MGDSHCYMNARDIFFKQQSVINCNCLPDCTSITYDVEISQVAMLDLNSLVDPVNKTE